MWIFTKHGFLSAVQNPKNATQVVVRARLKADLQYFLKSVGVRRKIVDTTDSDYRFRAVVAKGVFAGFVLDMAESIDYGNFKSTVPKVEHERHHAYLRAWGAMADLQDAIHPKPRPKAKQGRLVANRGWQANTGGFDEPADSEWADREWTDYFRSKYADCYNDDQPAD